MTRFEAMRNGRALFGGIGEQCTPGACLLLRGHDGACLPPHAIACTEPASAREFPHLPGAYQRRLALWHMLALAGGSVAAVGAVVLHAAR